MTGRPTRRSHYVYEALIFVIAAAVLWQYGFVAWLGVIAAELLAYFQGVDRGSELAAENAA